MKRWKRIYEGSVHTVAYEEKNISFCAYTFNLNHSNTKSFATIPKLFKNNFSSRTILQNPQIYFCLISKVIDRS